MTRKLSVRQTHALCWAMVAFGVFVALYTGSAGLSAFYLALTGLVCICLQTTLRLQQEEQHRLDRQRDCREQITMLTNIGKKVREERYQAERLITALQRELGITSPDGFDDNVTQIIRPESRDWRWEA